MAKLRFSFLGPLLAPSEPRGRPRRAEWRPKHFHTVCLGGTHPYHALGPLNGPLWHSWGPQKGSFRPRKALLGPRRSSWGPGGADLVPTAPDCTAWVGLMATTHFDLVSGPFWAPRGPNRARFGPKHPFWGLRRSSEGPGGPDLVPTASNGPPGLDSW